MHVFMIDRSQLTQSAIIDKFLSVESRFQVATLSDLIILDDLSSIDILEEGSPQKVVSMLDGSIPVLGTISPDPEKIHEAVSNHPNLLLLELNDKNLEETVTAAQEALFCNDGHGINNRQSCGAVVIRQHENGWETLLIQAKHGNWSFPKGRMNAGETEAITAVREIREETSIFPMLDVGFRKVVPSMFVDKSGLRENRDVIFFLAKAVGGTAQPQLSEISQLNWYPLSKEISSLIGYLPDRQVFHDAMSYLRI